MAIKRKSRVKIKSVVARTKRLKAGFIGSWALNGNEIIPCSMDYLLPHLLRECGKPPYDITIEVR